MFEVAYDLLDLESNEIKEILDQLENDYSDKKFVFTCTLNFGATLEDCLESEKIIYNESDDNETKINKLLEKWDSDYTNFNFNYYKDGMYQITSKPTSIKEIKLFLNEFFGMDDYFLFASYDCMTDEIIDRVLISIV